jgi:putative endonuclease
MPERGRELAARERAARRKRLGERAELIACDHLRKQSFEILARNVRLGRLELDIVARRGPLLVFCEVRSRSSSYLMTPAQSIDRRKVQHLRQAAAQWLRTNDITGIQVRFDVASVLFDTSEGTLNYLEGAF